MILDCFEKCHLLGKIYKAKRYMLDIFSYNFIGNRCKSFIFCIVTIRNIYNVTMNACMCCRKECIYVSIEKACTRRHVNGKSMYMYTCMHTCVEVKSVYACQGKECICMSKERVCMCVQGKSVHVHPGKEHACVSMERVCMCVQ